MSKSSHQEGIIRRYYKNRDTIALQNLGEIVSELYLCETGGKAQKLWERAGKALAHVAEAGLADRVNDVMSKRDVPALCRLVNELNAPGAVGGPDTGGASKTSDQRTATPTTPATANKPAIVSDDTGESAPDKVDVTDRLLLKRAMKAFRKRLKLTKLDEESNLSVSPLTGGAKSGVVAIQPPDSFPPEVWEALADQGRLKRSGRGFYALGDQ